MEQHVSEHYDEQTGSTEAEESADGAATVTPPYSGSAESDGHEGEGSATATDVDPVIEDMQVQEEEEDT